MNAYRSHAKTGVLVDAVVFDLGGVLIDWNPRHQVPLFALTNWARDTFLIAQERYPFLQWFRQVIVSGREGMAKPSPAIFHLMLERCGLSAGSTLFIDDSIRNVEAASRVGLNALVYRDARQLRRELAGFGLPVCL